MGCSPPPDWEAVGLQQRLGDEGGWDNRPHSRRIRQPLPPVKLPSLPS
jgi:hypothetical protein